MKFKSLIISLILVLSVSVSFALPSTSPSPTYPDQLEKAASFDDLVVIMDKVAISQQEDTSRGKGFIDGDAGYMAAFVYWFEGSDVEWEFEVINWKKDKCLELVKFRDGSYYIRTSNVVGYQLWGDDSWVNGLEITSEARTLDPSFLTEDEEILKTMGDLIDSTISGMDANRASRKYIEEKLRQKEVTKYEI